jgi:hypothetical protein
LIETRARADVLRARAKAAGERVEEQESLVVDLGLAARRSLARIANEVHVARMNRIRRLFNELIPPPINHGQPFDNDTLVRVSYPVTETERFVRYVRPDAVTVPAQELETLRRSMRPWLSQLTVFVDIESQIQLVG